MAIHFNSQKERFAYLRGEYKEIIPKLASESTSENAKSGNLTSENEEKVAKSELKRKKSTSKPKKMKKKEKKDDEVQAE